MMKPDTTIVSEGFVRRKTWLGIIALLLFISGSVFAWKQLRQQPKEAGALAPLRKGLDKNEAFFSTFFFSNTNLTKTFLKEQAAKKVRVNGLDGLKDDADTANWKLHLIRKPGDTLLIGIDEIRSLPKTEIVFNFKCIEGWSQISYWAGVKFSDFMKKYNLTEQSVMNYASLVTPDEKYYVGVDMASMMHPQTILCYEMNGQPLPLNQGFPLRLIIPVKYGVKHLKRIGSLSFDNNRPKDFWYERGYDYFCGL